MCSIIANWENWVVGIFSSAIPMGVTIIWGYLKWGHLYSKFQKMGVEKIFRDQQDAESCIVEECQRSTTLRVFAVRGDTFSNEENIKIAKAVQQMAKLKQFYLISSVADNKYLEERAKNIGDPELISGVKKSIEYFKRVSEEHSNIKLLLHKEIVRFRIILFDDYLFLSFVKENKRARQTEILKINKNSPLYKTYSTLFEELWDKYTPSQEPCSKTNNLDIINQTV